MNILASQIIEAAGAAPNSRTFEHTVPAGEASFAAALERRVDAMAAQAEPLTPAAPERRVEDQGDPADDEAAPDAIAALLAGLVPQLTLAATQAAAAPPAGQARSIAEGAFLDATGLPAGRNALHAAVRATAASASLAGASDVLSPLDAHGAPASAPTEGMGQPAPGTARPGAVLPGPLGAATSDAVRAAAGALAHGRMPRGEGGRATAADFLPPGRLAPGAAAIAALAHAQQWPLPADAAGAPAGVGAIGREVAEAGPPAAAMGHGLAVTTPARAPDAAAAPAAAASAAPAPAAAALASAPAAKDPDGPRADPASWQPSPAAAGPKAARLAAADGQDAPRHASGVTASGSPAVSTARTAASAEREPRSGNRAPDRADPDQPAAAAAALPGGLAAGAGGTGQPRAAVAAPVGSPEWPAALGQQLAQLPRGQEVELDLHPAELGPLKVKLSLQDGQAQLTFVAASPLVRDAIEAALPQLKTNLAEHGIGLGQTSVGSGSGQAQAHHGAAHEQRGERSAQPGSGRAREPSAAPAAAPRPRPRPGSIDAFA